MIHTGKGENEQFFFSLARSLAFSLMTCEEGKGRMSGPNESYERTNERPTGRGCRRRRLYAIDIGEATNCERKLIEVVSKHSFRQSTCDEGELCPAMVDRPIHIIRKASAESAVRLDLNKGMSLPWICKRLNVC